MSRIYLKDQSPTRRIPGMVDDTLLCYFPTRVYRGVSYLRPSVCLCWRETTTASAIHFVVNPWLRELDWKISAPISGRTYTTCDDHIDSTEVPWYGMPLELPRGYSGLPASPGPQKRMCLDCMVWLEQTFSGFRSIQTFLRGRLKAGPRAKPRRWRDVVDEHDPIQAVMDRVRSGTSAPAPERAEQGGGEDIRPGSMEVLKHDPDPEQPDRGVG